MQSAAEYYSHENHNEDLKENTKRGYENEGDLGDNGLPTKKVKSSEDKYVSEEPATLKEDRLKDKKDGDSIPKRTRHRTSNSTSSTASPAKKKLATSETNRDMLLAPNDEDAEPIPTGDALPLEHIAKTNENYSKNEVQVSKPGISGIGASTVQDQSRAHNQSSQMAREHARVTATSDTDTAEELDFSFNTDSEDTHEEFDEQGLGDSGTSGDSYLGKQFTLSIPGVNKTGVAKVHKPDSQGRRNASDKEKHQGKTSVYERSKEERDVARGIASAATRTESDTDSYISSDMEDLVISLKKEEAQKKLAHPLANPLLQIETSDSADSSDTETVKDYTLDREEDERTPTMDMYVEKPPDKQSRQDPGEGTSTGEQRKGHPTVSNLPYFPSKEAIIEQRQIKFNFILIARGNESSASASEQENQSPQSQGSSVDFGLDLDNPETPQQSETKSAVKVQRGNTLEDLEGFMPTSGIQHDSSLVTESTEQHEQASEQPQPSTDSGYSSGIRSSSASGTSGSSSMPIARFSGTSGSSSADMSPSVSVSTSVDNIASGAGGSSSVDVSPSVSVSPSVVNVAITEGSVSDSGSSSN